MPPAYDDARIHLFVLGEEREIACRARVGKTRVKELLPLVRSLASSISEIAVEHVQATGKDISCKKGCAHCCRQLVPVAPMEAKRLAEVVHAMPKKRADALRRRFVEAKTRLIAAKLLLPKAPKGSTALISTEKDPVAAWNDVSNRYFALQIDCPFLDDGACSIYDERPIACREYNVVTDPAFCKTLDPRIEATPRPIRFGEVLTRLGNELLGTTFAGIPLVLVLEWALAYGASQEREADGEAMFWALIRIAQEEQEEQEEQESGSPDATDDPKAAVSQEM